MSTEKLGKSGLGVLWNKILSVLSNKVDKETGKGLSTNDYTNDEKNKLANISEGGNKVYYGICETDSSESIKVVTCSDTSFVLKDGIEISVKFSYANAYYGHGIYLNVNNTGDIGINVDNTDTNGLFYIKAGSIIKFIFDNYIWIPISSDLSNIITDRSTATKIENNSKNLLTEEAVYYGLPTINNSKEYNSDTKIYAPTSAGITEQVLMATGGSPAWITPVHKTYYATCDTAIGTAAKVVTCSDSSFSLKFGVEINVMFTYGNNNSSNPTINVNSTGAKSIKFPGGLTGLYLSPNFTYKFIYDGTYWRFISETHGSIVSNGDFNKMTNPGFYMMRSASGNKPNSSGSYYGLLVLKSDNGNYVEQIAFKENSYELYIRALSGSTWKAWERVTTASSLSSDITSTLKDNGYDKKILFDGLMGSTTTLYGLTKHTTTDSIFSFYVILRIVGFGNENNKYSGGFVKELCIYYRTDASWGGTVVCTVNIEDDHNSGNYIKLTVEPNVCASSSGDVPQLNLDFTHASTMRIFKIESL